MTGDHSIILSTISSLSNTGLQVKYSEFFEVLLFCLIKQTMELSLIADAGQQIPCNIKQCSTKIGLFSCNCGLLLVPRPDPSEGSLQPVRLGSKLAVCSLPTSINYTAAVKLPTRRRALLVTQFTIVNQSI